MGGQVTTNENSLGLVTQNEIGSKPNVSIAHAATPSEEVP